MKHTLCLVALGVSLGSAQTWALTISIDANLADWGIDPATWLPSDPRVHYRIEDQTGGMGTYLGPGWGGQAYDAEAMYALIQGGKLYLALATGHDPRTVHNPAANSFGAGDFFIDFGKDGSYELAININHRLPTGFENSFIEGGAYRVNTYALGLWNEADPLYPVSPAKRPTYLTGGNYFGMATLAYSTMPANGWGQWGSDKHYFYELGVGLNLLTNAGWDGMSPFNVHWTMNCANDSIWLSVSPPSGVPEPATLALLSLGLIGIAASRRRPPG